MGSVEKGIRLLDMDIVLKLSQELAVQKWQVEAAVKLIDEGNTIPFISRYRKEATGSLNDEVLRNLYERLVYLRNLEEKKEQVIGSIEEQGKLTEELKEKILAAETLVVVEDLYRPYRPKRKTRASVAKEKGLDGLAGWILAQDAQHSLEEVPCWNASRRIRTPAPCIFSLSRLWPRIKRPPLSASACRGRKTPARAPHSMMAT